ncbi:hypothetical protein SAZ11_29445 [Streptomyces sp. FXJ1.4098]|nr:hypothetical protein [Streptomyces sp. FXJ1.4098]MDW6061395.1 hypothetical protein [Streptomyces sp. FXJ1.4098]
MEQSPHGKWEEILNKDDVVANIAAMALRSDLWIHRRVDSLQFASSSTMRWHTTVEFTIPDWAPEINIGGDDSHLRLMPLDLLRKQPRIGLEVLDESGMMISMLTIEQAFIPSFHILSTIARSIVPDQYDEHRLDSLINKLVRATKREDGILHLREIQDKDERLRSKEFVLFAYAFATRFLLLAPLAGEPGDRKTLTFNYDEHVYRITREGAKALTTRAFTSLGLTKDRYDCVVPQASDARIYHFEVSMPPGVLIANLEIRRRPRRSQGEDTDKEISDSTRCVRKVTPEEARVAVTDFPHNKQGVMVLHTLPAPQGWLATSVPVSWITFVILLVGLIILAGHVGKDVATAAAALLLALNSAIIALLAPKAEHALTRRAFASLRIAVGFLAIMPALTVLGMAFAVAVGTKDPPWLHILWTTVVIATGIVVLLLSSAWGKAKATHRKISRSGIPSGRRKYPLAAIGSAGTDPEEFIIPDEREWDDGLFGQVATRGGWWEAE